MHFIDWIIIVLILLFCVLGMLFGFGKGLKFFTGGIIGIIISIFICYALGGIIYNIGFVAKALDSFRNSLAGKGNTFCNILLKIQIDIIVYYVALFIVVTILRIIIVRILKNIFEIENVVIIIINKFFGVILFVGAFFVLLLLAFFVIGLIGGSTEANLLVKISDSKIGLDWLYGHNPFMKIIYVIRYRIEYQLAM